MPWYRGNLHCHSSRSDGKATPEHVAKFYKFIGYDFLGLSDHNHYTPLEDWAVPAGILGIPSCEYTAYKCCHVVAVGVKKEVSPGGPEGYGRKNMPLEKLLQDGVDKTLKAGGIPVLCHPGWNWTFDNDVVSKIKRCGHFEICNASPDCNSFPIPGYQPLEDMWDRLLSSGHRYYGLANDDAHEYYNPSTNRSPHAALGYNVVKIPSLSVKNILDAVRKGHFYASTGIVVRDFKVSNKGIRISVHPICREKLVFQFFGRNGEELQRTFGDKASYSFKGNELYVRIRIASTAGVWAWMQPVYLDDLNRAIKWTNAKY